MDNQKSISGTAIAVVTTGIALFGVLVVLLTGIRTDVRDINAEIGKINGWIRQHLTDHAGGLEGSEPPREDE